MPRRGGGGRSGGGRSGSGKGMSSLFGRPRAGHSGGTSQKSPERARPVAAAPPPPARAPMQAGSFMGGIGASIKDGLAFGGGSAVAHRVVDAVTGPRTIRHETVATAAPVAESDTMGTGSSLGSSDACGNHMKAFQDCLNNCGSEISKCQFYMDMLSECRKNSFAEPAGLNA